MTISVIVPVYNAEATLKKCLTSIAGQTYPHLQVIAVNDGSTDNSEQILQEFCNGDPRFTYLNLPHGGVSKARNAGLRVATGEYLQFTDADDELEENMLETLVGLMERHDADLAICRFEHPFFKTYVCDEVFDLRKREDLLRLYSDTYAMVMPWNKVWRRRCFTQPFDEEVHFSEDELGNLANLPNVKKAVTTKQYLYRYYFAKKEENKREESCVNQIINSVAFWENKTSFYYKGASLLEKRKAYIQTAQKSGKLSVQRVEDMAYLRLIDYCFWQMPAYIAMGVPCFGLTKENEHVFSEADFLTGFRAQEEYGFALLPLSAEEKKERCARFTQLCYQTFADKGADGNFKLAYAFISLFLKLFTAVTGSLNANNQNAKFWLDLQSNATPESKYVNGVLAL